MAIPLLKRTFSFRMQVRSLLLGFPTRLSDCTKTTSIFEVIAFLNWFCKQFLIVWAVFAESVESGTGSSGRPTGKQRFNCRYECFNGGTHYLCCENSLVFRYLATKLDFNERDKVAVVVNTNVRGGMGGALATVSATTDMWQFLSRELNLDACVRGEIFAHELGHIYGKTVHKFKKKAMWVWKDSCRWIYHQKSAGGGEDRATIANFFVSVYKDFWEVFGKTR